MVEAARERGWNAEIRKVAPDGGGAARGTRDEMPAWVGIVTPTHGFTAPEAALRAALRLPGPLGAQHRPRALVVATRGATRIGRRYLPGFEGSATLLIALILTLKGYRVRGVVGMDMPSNWAALHPGLASDAVTVILDRARRRVTAWTNAVLGGARRPMAVTTLLVGLLLLPGSLAYLLVGRRFLGKLFFASDRCTTCGLCAAHCPHDAIEMRGPEGRRRPYWTLRCQSCMRCMAYCPEQAVEANHLLAVAVFALAARLPVVRAVRWIADQVPGLAFLTRLPRWLLDTAVGALILSMVYPVLHRWLGLRWLNHVISRATLTRYYRRYHEPGTTLGDLG
jgi:Pyruvate/2-oxoacid:ferredoxin oxidoreductase delta subunit